MPYITSNDYRKEIERLRSVLEFALEMQQSVEDALPMGYGTPRNTESWMTLAKEVLANPYALAK